MLRERIAQDDASTLQQIRMELTASREQHMAASNAFENAQLTVDDIKTKLKTKIEHARRAIHESKKAEVMKGAASARSFASDWPRTRPRSCRRAAFRSGSETIEPTAALSSPPACSDR